ncbi:MAG: GNAT family N-acetyltransferase [Lachnospiraceae bacterium]|nr:GNAT family N-acetyltransferase [Lachnospiraceae bacterium]
MDDVVVRLKDIFCTIRVLKETDIEDLLKIKNEIEIHRERLELQKNGKACYLGAVINHCVIGFVLISLDNKKDVMPYTNNEKCADMIDLFVMKPFRGKSIGTYLIAQSERICKENKIFFLGLDVNPKDNLSAMELYKRLSYKKVGELHLDGIYPSKDENGKDCEYEDWCIDMIKKLN